MRSFRRNLASSSSSRPSPQSSSGHHRHHKVQDGGLFVKINMDGVPIGRKVDLTAYGGYADLSAAVGKLFRGLLAGTYARAAGPVSCKNGACPSTPSKKIVFFPRSRSSEGSEWRGGGGGGAGALDRRRLHAGVRGRGGGQGPCRRRPLGVSGNGTIPLAQHVRVNSIRILSSHLTCPSAVHVRRRMFVATAKRLRVLKSSDVPASSVSPRAARA